MFNSNQYDVIVIGSGIGGLTTAAILAKFNHKKVLILEQHFIVGGFTQEFKHKGFQWDIGVQAVTWFQRINRILRASYTTKCRVFYCQRSWFSLWYTCNSKKVYTRMD